MSLFPELDKVPGSGAKRPEDAPAPRKEAGPYVALARKYRPATFDEMVGQEAAVATLKNTIASGRLHHAYLFSGIRGVGKTTAARLFARALNCVEGPTLDPCGACDPCREITSGLSLDVIEIDAASNRGVDDVEPLREAARYAPSRDRYKVFILDEVHMLSNAAFNSLLKILEEPPPRIVWILATTEYRKVPPTVVSRCQHFEFRRVARAEVTKYLAGIASSEGVEVDAKGLEILAAAAGGSVRDAVSLLDQVIAYAGVRATEEDVRNAIGAIDRRLLVEFMRLVAARDSAKLIDLIASLAEGGVEFSQFAAGLVSTARDATLIRFASSGSRAVAATEEEARELRDLAAAFSEDGLLRVLNALLDLPYALRGAPQPRFVLEAAALRLTRLADLTPIEEVISRLQAGAGAAAPSSASPAGSPPRTSPGAAPATPASGASQDANSAGALPGGPIGSDPEEAVPEAGAEGGDGEGERRDRLLAAAQARKLSLRTFLEGAKRITVTDSAVEIVLRENQRFFRQSLETAESRALLREAAEEAVGRPVTVSIAVEGGADPDAQNAPPASGAGKRDRLIERALKQPGVKMVIDAFGGQIVDIRETP